MNPSIIRQHFRCIFNICDVKWAFSLMVTPPDTGVDGHSTSLLEVFISETVHVLQDFVDFRYFCCYQ